MTNIPTQFKKGHSGNPKGAPKKEWTWSGLLKKILEQKDPKTKKQWKTLVSKALIEKAATGDVLAIREMFNRMEGYPKQPTDITSGGKTIPLIPLFGKKQYVPGDDGTE